MRSVVLVHGAWHGAWCWASVLAGLDERGIDAVAVDLPGPDPHADADHVRGVLDDAGDEVVLVGHSYGGAVITDAGEHPSVQRLVYVAAFALDAGETVASVRLPGGELEEIGGAMRLHDDGTTTLDPELAGPILYGDCTPADTARAVSLLRPQPVAIGRLAPRAVAWRHRPTTYVLCGADRTVPPSLQRAMAERIPDVALVEWPDASHSPFISRPDAVADLLAGLASA